MITCFLLSILNYETATMLSITDCKNNKLFEICYAADAIVLPKQCQMFKFCYIITVLVVIEIFSYILFWIFII